MSVRSTTVYGPARFVTPGTHLLYTVPADRTLIVRSVWLECRVAGPCQAAIELRPAGGSVGLRFFDRTDLVLREHVVLDHWWVLEEGDSIWLVDNTANSINCLISGSLLLGDPA